MPATVPAERPELDDVPAEAGMEGAAAGDPVLFVEFGEKSERISGLVHWTDALEAL